MAVAFKKLNLPFVFLGGFQGAKGAEIPAFSRPGVALSGIQPVFAGTEMAYHVCSPLSHAF